jgi:hypothetical protein
MLASPAYRPGVGEFGRDMHNSQSLVTFKGFALINEMKSGISLWLGAVVASLVYLGFSVV